MLITQFRPKSRFEIHPVIPSCQWEDTPETQHARATHLPIPWSSDNRCYCRSCSGKLKQLAERFLPFRHCGTSPFTTITILIQPMSIRCNSFKPLSLQDPVLNTFRHLYQKVTPVNARHYAHQPCLPHHRPMNTEYRWRTDPSPQYASSHVGCALVHAIPSCAYTCNTVILASRRLNDTHSSMGPPSLWGLVRLQIQQQ